MGRKKPPQRLVTSMPSSSATYSPRPLCARTRPSAERIFTASRTTVRLVPSVWARSFSVGIRSPGYSRTSAMSSRIRSATIS